MAPAWINSVVKDIYDQTHSRILPSIQVKEAYLESTLSTEIFRKALEESLKPPSQGVIFWSWEKLDAENQIYSQIWP